MRSARHRLSGAPSFKAGYPEARELGLLGLGAVAAGAKDHELLTALEGIVTKTSGDAHISGTALDSAAKEYAELEKEEGAVSLQLVEVKTRLDNMTKLQAAVSDYTDAIGKQRDRLQLSRWFRDLAESLHETCPVCGGDFDHVNGELDALCDALANVEATARQVEPVPAAFDKELVQVRAQARRVTDSLNGIRARKRAIEERSKRVKEERLGRGSVDRFLGRMEQALKVLRAPEGDPAFAAEVADLKARLEERRKGLSDTEARNRQRAALERVSRTMARLLPGLDSERPQGPGRAERRRPHDSGDGEFGAP